MVFTLFSRLLVLPIIAISCSALLFLIGVCIYNLWFHPYAAYPGPFWARVSPFHALWHAYHGDLHIDTLLCHQKYGPVVRYAPNRLIFNTTTGLKGMYQQATRNLGKVLTSH